MKIGIALLIHAALAGNFDARVDYALGQKIFSTVEKIEREVIPFYQKKAAEIREELTTEKEGGGVAIPVEKYREKMNELEQTEIELELKSFTEEELSKLTVTPRETFALRELVKKGETK